MSTFKRICVAALAAMLLINLAPATVFAAAKSPYCRIAYSSAASAMTTTYYSYDKDGVAQVDFSRNVKWFDGKVYLTKNNTLVTSKLAGESTPTWTSKGEYLVWMESDLSVWSRKYGALANVQLAEKAREVGINADHMAATVTLPDNSSKTISALIKTPLKNGNEKVEESTESSSSTNTGTSSNGNNSTTTTTSKVTMAVNSAGETIVNFDTHKIKVDGADVYLDKYKISEFCASGAKFVGVDELSHVYLFEDNTSSLYQFPIANIFTPSRIKFAKGCELNGVKTDKTGVLTGIDTSNGFFTIEQLVEDESWYPVVSYVINKKGYATYYIQDTTKKYNMSLKDDKLYLDDEIVASGITRNTESFGFKGAYLEYLVGSQVFRAPLSNPKKAVLLYQNVLKLEYSSQDGQVAQVKKLSSVVDYVKNGAGNTSATLYQSGKKVATVKITSSGKKVKLGSKVIATTSAAQKFKAVSFTEDGYVFYTTEKQAYRAPLSSPEKAKKWSIKSYKYDSTLGFVTKAS